MGDDLHSEPKRWRGRTRTQTAASSIHWPPAAFPVVALGAPGMGPISYRPPGPGGAVSGEPGHLGPAPRSGPAACQRPLRTAARCLPRCFWLQSPHTQACIPPPLPILTIMSEVTPSAGPGELCRGGGDECLSAGPKLLIYRASSRSVERNIFGGQKINNE